MNINLKYTLYWIHNYICSVEFSLSCDSQWEITSFNIFITNHLWTLSYSSVFCLLHSFCYGSDLLLFQSLSHIWLFCDLLEYSAPGASVHEISQARILEWVAIFFSRGSSHPRNQTCISFIGRWILYTEPPRKFMKVLVYVIKDICWQFPYVSIIWIPWRFIFLSQIWK